MERQPLQPGPNDTAIQHAKEVLHELQEDLNAIYVKLELAEQNYTLVRAKLSEKHDKISEALDHQMDVVRFLEGN